MNSERYEYSNEAEAVFTPQQAFRHEYSWGEDARLCSSTAARGGVGQLGAVIQQQRRHSQPSGAFSKHNVPHPH